MESTLSISIIIATYNRAGVLKETLENLILHYGNQFLISNSEIIVIDNNSKDETYAVVNLIAQQYRFVKYFSELVQGLSHARNRGIRESKNKFLIFADDDIEVDKEWLDASINPLLQNPEVGVVGGQIVPHGQTVPNWIPSKYYWLVGITNLGNEKKWVEHAMGASMAIRKSIFDEVGYFDPTLGRNGNQLLGGEEVDIQRRIKEKGYKILYNPTAVVYHKIGPKLNETYILQFAYLDGLSNQRMDRKANQVKYKFKTFYGMAAINLFLPLKSIYGNPIEVSIRKSYFKGYLTQN